MAKKPEIYKPKLTTRKREFDIDRAKVAIDICEWQSKSEKYRADWRKSYEDELKNLYNDKDDGDENFSIPLSLYHTDKKHSSIYNVIFGMNKMIIAKPTSSEDVEPVRKKEQWMNWELKTHMNQVDPELGISNQGDKFVHGVVAFGEAIGMVTWEVVRKYGKEYRIFKLPKFAPEETEQSLIEGRARGGDIFQGQPYLVGEQGPEVIVPQESGTVIPNYGLREDGTPKGNGWLGPLQMKDGRIMTEYSMGVNIDGKDILIPSVVPTLSQEELNYLLNGGNITNSIKQKAVEFAKERIKQGLSPFKD